MKKIAECQLQRNLATASSVLLGIILGFVNLHLRFDFQAWYWLLLDLCIALLLVVFLHEGTHALIAKMLHHHPVFGIKLPLVYITFNHKLPKWHFIAIALGPFVLLTLLFATLYNILGSSAPNLTLIALLALELNILGAIGDLWMVARILLFPAIAQVQDTKSGFEVWIPEKTERVGH